MTSNKTAHDSRRGAGCGGMAEKLKTEILCERATTSAIVHCLKAGGHKTQPGGREVDMVKEKGATLARNPLFYLVELAGVEPASEIPTSSVLHA